jgi:hypothetical protein
MEMADDRFDLLAGSERRADDTLIAKFVCHLEKRKLIVRVQFGERA